MTDDKIMIEKEKYLRILKSIAEECAVNHKAKCNTAVKNELGKKLNPKEGERSIPIEDLLKLVDTKINSNLYYFKSQTGSENMSKIMQNFKKTIRILNSRDAGLLAKYKQKKKL